MALEVTMPQMGESVVEGTVAKWLVKVGDEVRQDQPLCEISTDKVDTEVPSPGAGVVSKILAGEGDTVPVGAVLALIEGREAAASTTGADGEAGRPSGPPPSATEGTRTPVSELAATGEAKPAAGNGEARAYEAGASLEAGQPGGASAQTGEHRRYSPVVLKMAAEYGVDLSRVPGTGTAGRVSKRDLMRYVESLKPAGTGAAHAGNGGKMAHGALGGLAAAAAAAKPVVSGLAGTFRPPLYEPKEGDVVEPFSRRRRIIAEHMVYSKMHAPHVGTVAEVDVTRVAGLREARKDEFGAREGFALTFLPIAAAATVRALKEFPRMNASVVGEALVIRKEINLGIAMDTEEGLLVPVVRRADEMSVVGVAREIEKLRRKVAEKQVTAEDLVGGSFTLSNPGREGNLFGLAIINQPQVGILRMGELKKRPVVVEVDGAEAIAIRTIMHLALSYDHRVIDGVLGNRFLYRVARILEEADFDL